MDFWAQTAVHFGRRRFASPSSATFTGSGGGLTSSRMSDFKNPGTTTFRGGGGVLTKGTGGGRAASPMSACPSSRTVTFGECNRPGLGDLDTTGNRFRILEKLSRLSSPCFVHPGKFAAGGSSRAHSLHAGAPETQSCYARERILAAGALVVASQTDQQLPGANKKYDEIDMVVP